MRRSPLSVGIFLGILLLLVIGTRFFFGNEDTWICVNERWVKHGNPSAPMPENGCGPLERDALVFRTFGMKGFDAIIPDWQQVDRTVNPQAAKAKVAVTHPGCTFVLTTLTLPEEETLPTFIGKLIATQRETVGVQVQSQDIRDTTTAIESVFQEGTQRIRSVQRGYLSRNRTFTSLVFSGPAETFDTACAVWIPPVTDSVKVR